jgi:hypothetical protein
MYTILIEKSEIRHKPFNLNNLQAKKLFHQSRKKAKTCEVAIAQITKIKKPAFYGWLNFLA